MHTTDTFHTNNTKSRHIALFEQLYLSLFIPLYLFSQVNDSSPKTVLSQLCELLAARPLQGLVYEEERPPRTAWGPLAPMLEFVSAQTGLPIVAVGGGAGLGRMPQVGGGRLGLGWESEEEVFAACVCVWRESEEYKRADVPDV